MQISRIREKRADMIATISCGNNSFSKGLRKVVGFSSAFHIVSNEHIISELKNGKVYENYYKVFRDIQPELKDLVEQHEKEALSETEDKYDSHPKLKTRLNYIPNVREKFNDRDLSLVLFQNLEEYEKISTEKYSQLLAIISGYYS